MGEIRGKRIRAGLKTGVYQSQLGAEFGEDLGAGAGAYAGGAGLDHFLQVSEGADAAGSFYADVRPYYGAHEGDVFDSCARGAEAGAGFYEVGADGGGQAAGADFFFFGEQASFDNHFADCVGGVGGVANGADIRGDRFVLSGFQGTDVDDHV